MVTKFVPSPFRQTETRRKEVFILKLITNLKAVALGLVLLVGPAACVKNVDAPEASAASEHLYFVDVYDENRNPEADLAAALEQADGRRILLEIGGNWCSWCMLLDNYMEKEIEVRNAFAESFIIVKINYSDENKNEAFLEKYPPVGGYPHFIVLDSDGSLLASQGTGELEQGKGYSKKKMLAFAEKWRT